MSNIQTTKNLLLWMEQHLNQQANFSVEEIRKFFADEFVIKTNSRVVHATPETYRDYLYKLKSSLKSVKYDLDEMFDAAGVVISPFVIHMNFTDKKSQSLMAISIFRFSADRRIVEWKEVFADANKQELSYDPR